ncbi:Uncharacterised protein [Acinetobacter baumannii]|nr:Uncharacterised protein [Acinetobacter baumannii]
MQPYKLTTLLYLKNFLERTCIQFQKTSHQDINKLHVIVRTLMKRQ